MLKLRSSLINEAQIKSYVLFLFSPVLLSNTINPELWYSSENILPCFHNDLLPVCISGKNEVAMLFSIIDPGSKDKL